MEKIVTPRDIDIFCDIKGFHLDKLYKGENIEGL